MSKDELLQLLKEQASIKNLKFPEDIDISLQDDILTITMTPKGLISNMQENSAAFEGWALAIKATLDKPDIPIHIVWACDDTNIHTDLHYIRFLYRVIRFQENYGNDAAIVLKPKDQNAQNDLDRISRELSECQWVINYPNQDAQNDANHGEARLERQILGKLQKPAGEQLPVGLFIHSKAISNARTPYNRSQIDLWSLDNQTLTVYELKDEGNKEVGIVSELMFYANVMKDVIDGRIKYPEDAEESTYRGFNELYPAIKGHKIVQLSAIFLTNELHPLLEHCRAELFSLLNGNNRQIHYGQKGYQVSSLFDITK